MSHDELARLLEEQGPARVPGGGRWRAWLSRRRTLRNQQLLATGSGVRMMSASLTTLERDPAALGWLDGGQFFPAAEPAVRNDADR